jgi:YHS domain-containing protein
MRTASLAMLFIVLFAGLTFAAARDHSNTGKDRVGIKGYDPVSYFDGTPTKGDAKITAEHEGVIYRFASEANRTKFAAEPNRFAPAYGGWCATAFAFDKGKVDIDPKNYRVTDGRLYLFYKGWGGNALKEWVKDEPANIVKADASWKRTVGE